MHIYFITISGHLFSVSIFYEHYCDEYLFYMSFYTKYISVGKTPGLSQNIHKVLLDTISLSSIKVVLTKFHYLFFPNLAHPVF